MAQAVILEFTGVGRDQYDAVNGKLGIDSTRKDADWPPGLETHIAGTTPDGGLVVVEVWESQEAQGTFMESQLGDALHDAGVPAPSRVTWLDVVAATSITG
jgi:hypothetical protein